MPAPASPRALLLVAGGLLAAACAAPVAASAQTATGGLTRTLVGRADVSVPGREAVVARVEVAPGGRSGRHTHPGDEISYVIDGEAQLSVDGQPTRTVKAGESFVIPAGTVHEAVNAGGVPVRLVGVYVVEKGKPLATPAP